MTARARIDRAAVGIARPIAHAADGARDFETRAEAGIQQAAVAQPLDRGRIEREMLRLAQDRLLPREAEPGEIVENGLLVLRTATVEIDVLHPQEEAAIVLP